MDNDSLNPDLNGTPCAVTSCTDVADVVGAAQVEVHHLTGVPEDEAVMTLDVPLCVPHAHLLRMGVEWCRFDPRLT